MSTFFYSLKTIRAFRCVLICLLLSPSVFAQQSGDIRVIFEPTDDGEYIFYAQNDIAKDTHIVVVLTEGVNQWRADSRLPFQKTVSTGRTRLFKLAPIGTSPPRFNYKFYYYQGVGNPDINDVEYSMPAPEGESVKVGGASTIPGLDQSAMDLEGHYGISFLSSEVRNMRDGQVKSIKTISGEPNRSFIQIRHRDGTIGHYSGIVHGTEAVREDEFIKAGDLLAKSGNSRNPETPYFSFSVSYLKVVVNRNLNSREWSSSRYLVPLFRTKSGEKVRLKSNMTYVASYPDELITQEMSKREKKKYLKGKK